MAQRNGTAVHVGLGGGNSEQIHVDQADDAERLVELKKVDVVHGDSGPLGGQGNRFGRSRREPLRFVGRVSGTRDAGEGLQS